MASSEVFRPSDGELLIRDALAHGPKLSVETFRKEGHRPQTQGGYRFGQLSRHSFFTRHNPHPSRVKHIKGLLDVPICAVNDDGYFANPRYSLQFPPSSFDNQTLKNWKGRVPVNAISFNRQHQPSSSITGLYRFAGLTNYPFKEKAIPRVGLVPVTETWRDELAAFTRALELDEDNGFKESAPSKPVDETRPRSTVYSPETGRIVPPPSRALSRGQSRRSMQFIGGNFQHISAHPDAENLVLVMLCQILQTDDINAVQAWLCSAGEREKGLVMNLVKNALSGIEESDKQYPTEFVLETGKAKLPPINEKHGTSNGEINRLVLDDGKAHNNEGLVKVSQNNILPTEGAREISFDEAIGQQMTRAILDEGDITIHHPNDDVVKPPSALFKPTLTPLQPVRLGTASKQEKVPKPSFSKSRLKYAKSSFSDKIDAMWCQNQSVNTF